MTPALALTLAAACTWASPGDAPYRGDLGAAVDRYRDIPAEVRATLKRRIEARQYDELVTIRRDGITGGQYAYTGLRDMHWRDGMCAGPVVGMDKWAAEHAEGAMVFCESGHCLAWPARCRNLARVDRAEQQIFPTRADGPLQEIPGGTGTSTQTLDLDAPEPDLVASGSMPSMRSLSAPGDAPAQPVEQTFSAGSGMTWPAVMSAPAVLLAGVPFVTTAPLDSVVTPIPEASRWAMMLAGLAMIAGFRTWRTER